MPAPPTPLPPSSGLRGRYPPMPAPWGGPKWSLCHQPAHTRCYRWLERQALPSDCAAVRQNLVAPANQVEMCESRYYSAIDPLASLHGAQPGGSVADHRPGPRQTRGRGACPWRRGTGSWRDCLNAVKSNRHDLRLPLGRRRVGAQSSIGNEVPRYSWLAARLRAPEEVC